MTHCCLSDIHTYIHSYIYIYIYTYIYIINIYSDIMLCYCRWGKIHWAKYSQFQCHRSFAEIFSHCLGHKYSLFSIIKERHLATFTEKLSRYSRKPWKTWKFSPANLSPFMVLCYNSNAILHLQANTWEHSPELTHALLKSI